MKKDHFVFQSGVPKTKSILHRGTEKSSQDFIKKNAPLYTHKGKNFSVYKGKSNPKFGEPSAKKTNFKHVHERKLTAAELKKREEIAKAIERDNPGMDMSRKMAIATATAKRVIAAEDAPGNAVAQGGVNMAPNMGPRVKSINVTDRRRRKDKHPVMLKRFRSYTEAMSSRQDSDIADRKGSQPAVYHAGLKKSTKKKRDAQFKKQSKMADDNPAAYKPAPGDKSAKTKPSVHTKKFKKMFGDD